VIVGAIGAGFCEDVTRAGILRLNLCQSAVLAENRQGVEENFVVRTSCPVSEIVAHEFGAEEIRPIAACAVALGRSRQIEIGFREEGVFEFESLLERVGGVFSVDCAKKIRTHASVKILANLERDLDLLSEGQRDVFGN